MNEKIKRVAVSGYFDPVHVGHLEMFKEASRMGELTVIINNDQQTEKKKGFVFMSANERAEIIKAIKYVDKVFISIDDDSTVCRSLESVHPDIFANGGDRFVYNTPESDICKINGIKMVFGVGQSGKIQSSSKLVKNAILNTKIVQQHSPIPYRKNWKNLCSKLKNSVIHSGVGEWFIHRKERENE